MSAEVDICRRKIAYRTIEKARNAQTVRSAESGEDLRIYTCRVCGWFHLTKKADGSAVASK